jgi:hypothetical protein
MRFAKARESRGDIVEQSMYSRPDLCAEGRSGRESASIVSKMALTMAPDGRTVMMVS